VSNHSTPTDSTECERRKGKENKEEKEEDRRTRMAKKINRKNSKLLPFLLQVQFSFTNQQRANSEESQSEKSWPDKWMPNCQPPRLPVKRKTFVLFSFSLKNTTKQASSAPQML
jgi:hypothetical protein